MKTSFVYYKVFKIGRSGTNDVAASQIMRNVIHLSDLTNLGHKMNKLKDVPRLPCISLILLKDRLFKKLRINHRYIFFNEKYWH